MTSVTNATQQSSVAAQTGQAAASMTGADFNMFLKLLTTQMQNQDPLDPMDTSEYTQQLVQYSQVEQSMQQTGVLRDILSRLSAADMAQASGFIGREAEFDTNVAGLGANGAEWTYSLPREAASLTATVKDASGRTVASKVLDASTEGRFTWDGALADGSTAPAGEYALTLQALDASGNAITPTIRSIGKVDSVTSASGNVMLGVNGIELPSGTLVSVAQRAGA
ncbi:flagellar hook assembly protein FlgD [Novosphingobium sp. M1R2S20]|uniref:Basal-body rod modification protein FlgD n=1 Tax=Novosphingobium rhizovicinum TaxID=3228928 RepID=A0ABV3R8U6_9SPHN